MQEYAYNVYWPERLRAQDPALTGEALETAVKKFCAKPNKEGPHISGGSVDVALINLDTGEFVDRGTGSSRPIEANYPDYYENYDGSLTEVDEAIVSMRRVLYYAMTEIAGLQPNPTEIWHYGRGDKLWAYMEGSLAYYQGVITPKKESALSAVIADMCRNEPDYCEREALG